MSVKLSSFEFVPNLHLGILDDQQHKLKELALFCSAQKNNKLQINCRLKKGILSF